MFSLLRLPPTWAAPVGERRADAVQFVQFGLVGSIGFLFDTATVYAVRYRIGLYGAGIAGYVVAASLNWLLNRTWTFRGHRRDAMHRQWARFLIANLGGFVLNRGTYSALITFFPLVAQVPVIAVAAGAIVGLAANFLSSRRFVFR